MSIVKKRKHVSKKNKKAWRKYCDIKDVEDFLDDQRLEERIGKFETKSDSELFVIDTVGNDEKKPDEKPLSAKLRKRANLPETPKCFEVLLPTSKVQDPNTKRNHLNPVGFKPTSLSKLTDKRRFEKGLYQRKVEVARKNRKLALEKKRKAKKQRDNFDKDIWGQDLSEVKGIPSTLCEEFISPEAQLHNVLPTQRLRAKPPLPTTVITRAAVELPHPGVSYNPTYQEHQELLQNVVQHEQKLMQRERHLHRVTTGMFRKITQSEKENQWREEMSEGLPKPHNPATQQQDSDTDEGYKAINPPVRNKKKDHKTRRRQREMLVEKEKLKQEKINKKKNSDIYRLRKLQSSIKSAEVRQEEERKKRISKRVLAAASETPCLNAHAPPVIEPDFVDPGQLTGDLRSIKSNTNHLKDRFDSLQRRGVLAATKIMMKKKRKVKSYFKAGHKVTEQEIEKYVNKMKN